MPSHASPHDPCRRARQFTSPFSPSLPSQTPPNPSLPARPRPALRPSSSCPPRTRRGDRNPVPSHASPHDPRLRPSGGRLRPRRSGGHARIAAATNGDIHGLFIWRWPLPWVGPSGGARGGRRWQRVGRLQLQVPSCLARSPSPGGWQGIRDSGAGDRRPGASWLRPDLPYETDLPFRLRLSEGGPGRPRCPTGQFRGGPRVSPDSRYFPPPPVPTCRPCVALDFPAMTTGSGWKGHVVCTSPPNGHKPPSRFSVPSGAP